MPLSSYLGYITPILQVSFKSLKLGPQTQKYGQAFQKFDHGLFF
jgi:hypothetical protein